jgi:hypothetical protein
MKICNITKILEKYFPLYVLLSIQNYFRFFRTSTFRDIWWKIPGFLWKIICWFTLAPLHKYCAAWLVYWVFASHMGGQWIVSLWITPYFLCRNKTSEYSKIYSEQLTSEHFLLYNYRSSTLREVYRPTFTTVQCGMHSISKDCTILHWLRWHWVSLCVDSVDGESESTSTDLLPNEKKFKYVGKFNNKSKIPKKHYSLTCTDLISREL